MGLSAVYSNSIFDWENLPDFPNPHGLKGYYALSNDEQWLILGGSTFPVPQNEGGAKTYYDSIYKLQRSESGDPTWQTMKQRLPLPMAEGASLQWKDQLLLIGGMSADGPLDSCIQMHNKTGDGNPIYTNLPPLPTACFHPAAAIFSNRLFVAGGHDGSGGLTSFHVLNLGTPNSQWGKLPSWPGPKRFGAILEILNDGVKDYLYLFSGKTETTNPRSQVNYLKDVYRFDLEAETWERMNDMPRAALIGIPGKINDSTLSIFSGSDGHDIERIEEIGDAYRLTKDILIYSAKDDSWTNGGEMPLGVIGVPLLKTNDGFILASGEYSPGKRSEKVYRIHIKNTH